MRPEEQEPVLPPRSSIHRYITWADMDLVNSNYECPVEYSGEEGVILSHPTWSAEDYPDSYRSPLAPTPRRRWYLAVEEGHRIQVTWTDFKLEGAASGASCGYDYAAVLDSSGEVREGAPRPSSWRATPASSPAAPRSPPPSPAAPTGGGG